jgi:hypothetical protein
MGCWRQACCCLRISWCLGRIENVSSTDPELVTTGLLHVPGTQQLGERDAVDRLKLASKLEQEKTDGFKFLHSASHRKIGSIPQIFLRTWNLGGQKTGENNLTRTCTMRVYISIRVCLLTKIWFSAFTRRGALSPMQSFRSSLMDPAHLEFTWVYILKNRGTIPVIR